MKREDLDIKHLMYDPFDQKTPSKLSEYDEFKGEFTYTIKKGKGEDGEESVEVVVIKKDKVCCYIILLYDMQTQLRREIPYLNQRKIIAAELSGFPKNKDGKFKKEYEDLMLGSNVKVSMAISKYVRLFSSPKYISLVYYWSILSAEYSNITSQSESKDFKNTIGNIEKLEAKINECVDILFGGKETEDIQKALYQSVERENLRLTPEVIANSEDLESLLGSPYGEDYKIDALKFKGNK
jgi:hypothetical protein